MFYNAVDDYAKSPVKADYIRGRSLTTFDFKSLVPDTTGDWFTQADTGFASLIPVANRETKLARKSSEEQAVFGLYSMGAVTNRDEWVYDFDSNLLELKVRAFINIYEETRTEFGGQQFETSVPHTEIKWTRDLKRQLFLNKPNVFNRDSIRQTLYRPYVRKPLYYNQNLNEMLYQLPDVFPMGTEQSNKAICFCVNGRDFYALATDRVVDLHFTGDTQCLPRYRYTGDDKRVNNITEWGLRRFNDHYRREWGKDFQGIYPEGIGPDDIFAYTYAVLHDPVYRHDYATDLLREFPRLPFYHDFDLWTHMGQQLLDLHIGFESAEPYALKREETGKEPGKPKLRADKEKGIIVLDDATRLTGVPEDAWHYRLGSRSALEWVLDQYKEHKPKDPTIAERFDTYRFADYKDQVIDLLRRVCTVSVKTMEIVDSMAYWDGDDLVVFGDRDKHEMAALGLSQWGSESEDAEWEAAWSET